MNLLFHIGFLVFVAVEWNVVTSLPQQREGKPICPDLECEPCAKDLHPVPHFDRNGCRLCNTCDPLECPSVLCQRVKCPFGIEPIPHQNEYGCTVCPKCPPVECPAVLCAQPTCENPIPQKYDNGCDGCAICP